MKTLCCVNDMPGVGKIAMAAMMPILSAKGVNIASLPTALVSNTLDFGKFEIMDTTDYMDKTVDVWKELGFYFDCISTGFMVNPRQIEIVERLIRNQQKDDLLVVVDPIMGDEGKLYNGMTDENVKIFRKLSAYADILIPNFTEACFLTDHFYEKNMLKADEVDGLLNGCRALGARSVVITSAKVEGADCVVGYDHITDETFRIDFEMIDLRFPGTGDIFSAMLISEILGGSTLRDATAAAMDTVKDIIKENADKKEKFFGVDIEKYISEGKL